MAKNGLLQAFSFGNGNYTIYFEWSLKSQDIRTNTSLIEWQWYIQDNNGYGLGEYLESPYVTTTSFDSLQVSVGTTIDPYWISKGSPSVDLEPYKTVTIATGETTIVHTSFEDQIFYADLDASRFGAFQGKSGITQSFTFADSFGRVSDHIDHIVRIATLSSVNPTSGTDEDTYTINYENPAGTYASSLMAGISLTTSDENMAVPYRGISKTNGSYTFTFTEEEKAKLYTVLDDNGRTNTRLRVFLKCVVPDGGTSYTTSLDYYDITMSFINYQPTLNVTLYDTNQRSLAVTGDNQTFVRGISDAYFNLGATVYKGATIKNVWIQNGDKLINAAIGYLTEITSDTFYVYVEDNRGYHAAQTIVIPEGKWLEYFPLTCKIKNTPLDANGSVRVTITGKYFQGNFGKVSNTMKLEYFIQKVGTTGEYSPVSTITPTVDTEGNYTYTFTITGLDYKGRYNLEVLVIDAVMTDKAIANTIVAAQPLFDWGATDFAFYIPVTINGASVPTVYFEGEYDGWNYRLWSNGTAECWRNLSVSATISNATAGWYSSGQLTDTNLDFPFTFAEQPTVNVSLIPTGSTWAVIFPSNTGGSTEKTGSYQLMSTSSFAAKTYLLSYQVKGKWR